MGSPRCGAACAGSFTCTRSGPEPATAWQGRSIEETEEEHMAVSKPRRATLGAIIAGAALALAGGTAQAQCKDDIVIGASLPMSAVFAFAGLGVHAGIQDFVKSVNGGGGIGGRK